MRGIGVVAMRCDGNVTEDVTARDSHHLPFYPIDSFNYIWDQFSDLIVSQFHLCSILCGFEPTIVKAFDASNH